MCKQSTPALLLFAFLVQVISHARAVEPVTLHPQVKSFLSQINQEKAPACDVLRDEGERYARRLKDAGVPATHRRYKGMTHGFVHFCGVLDVGRTAISDVARVIQAACLTDETSTQTDADVISDNTKERDGVALTVTDVTLFGDMECFRIKTPMATYLYGKKGAGFASIFDMDGHDWISYRHGNTSKGEYRGMPKCGQPTKYFHCGYGFGDYQNNNPFESKVTQQTDDHIRIESATRDGKSACYWDFYPDHATFTLLKMAIPQHWFLYEGTPGGKLDPKDDFVIRPSGQKTPLNEYWSEVVPWVCFGAAESPAGLLCINHQPPEPGQTDSYVAWPFQKQDDGSFQDMTVFGFGRKGYRELTEHVADLKKLPAQYSIAMLNRADHAMAKAAYERLRTPAAENSK